MWVDCHNCMGLGFIKSSKPCSLCNYGTMKEQYLIGQIWVNDNYRPCSPPSSPRTQET